MSDVKANSAPPEAASPSHPQHARWVKERTLAMEIAHQQRIGGTLREAEDANMRSLERLAARRRDDSPAPQAAAPAGARDDQPNIGHSARVAQRGVTRRAAAELETAPSSPCNYCGQCVRCKREARVHAIMARARKDDPAARELTKEMVGAVWAQQQRRDYKSMAGVVYPFSRAKARQRQTMLNALIDAVCDRSVKLLGAWR